MTAHSPVHPPYWWACQWPERKPEFGYTLAGRDCEACILYKEAAVQNYAGAWVSRLGGPYGWCEVVP